VNEDIYNLHLNADRAIGKDKTCDRKLDYKTEKTAIPQRRGYTNEADFQIEIRSL
jgi:hypothetical protein